MPSANKAKTKSGLKALLVAALIVLVSFSAYRLLNEPSGLPIVRVDGVGVEVEVAEAFADRKMGLSNRESLPTNQGMFFVFEESSQHGF